MEGKPRADSKGDKTETSKAWRRHMGGTQAHGNLEETHGVRPRHTETWRRHTGGDPGTWKPGGCQTVWHLYCHW